jgi:hypothetical protein
MGYASTWRIRTGRRVRSGRHVAHTNYWTRRAIAEWLVIQVSSEKPMLVGIDHAFSFPVQYFERHRLQHDWPSFLEDFQHHWPTDNTKTSVESLRNGNIRTGDASWFRLTEQWTASAKSVFRFDVRGQVAKSTHAGLPWLRHCGISAKGASSSGRSMAGQFLKGAL